jgi:tetratricopeptide (TPR) repeat protein
MLQRVSSVSLLALTMVGGLPGQIPTRARPLGAPVPNAPPLMVANPYTIVAADSAAAVAIGTAIRDRMAKRVVGRDWNVVTRAKMNEALSSFGYPNDAILSPDGARLFAQKVGSTRHLLMPVLTKLPDGRYHITARLTGTFNANDMAGFVAQQDQEPGQKLDDFGSAVADHFKSALKAMTQNDDCYGNMYTDTEKATDAAEKALKTVPGFAPAKYCLGMMKLLADSTSAEAESLYREAIASDPYSLKAYTQLGVIYQKRADSTQVISTYQQMLRLEPLNPTLREAAFDLFRAYGSQDAAEQVADEGIRTDPNNTDWYDLKSNACLAQEKFACAVTELETLFSVDSTRADSSFYRKINVAAHFGSDTVRYAKWAAKGIAKYPNDPVLLLDAATAFAMAGDIEGSLDATRRLLAINPADLEPLRALAVMLGGAGEAGRLREFLPMVKASGDADLQNTFGNVLVNGASKLVSTDLVMTDSLAQAALDAGTTDANLLSYANYFIALHTLDQIRTMAVAVRDSKNCDAAREYQAVLQRAKPALAGAMLNSDSRITDYASSAAGSVDSELAVIPQMIEAFCK